MLLWCLVSKRFSDCIKTGYLISSGSVLYSIMPTETRYTLIPYCGVTEMVAPLKFDTLNAVIDAIARPNDIKTFEVVNSKIVLNNKAGMRLGDLPIVTAEVLEAKDVLLEGLKTWYICEKGNYHYVAECDNTGVYYKKLIRSQVLDYVKDAFYNVLYVSDKRLFKNKAEQTEYEGMPLPKTMGIKQYVNVEDAQDNQETWVQHIAAKIKNRVQISSMNKYSECYSSLGIGRNAIMKHDMLFVKKNPNVFNIFGFKTIKQLFYCFDNLDLKSLYDVYYSTSSMDFEKLCTTFIDDLLKKQIDFKVKFEYFNSCFTEIIRNIDKSEKFAYVYLLYDKRPYYLCNHKDFAYIYSKYLTKIHRVYNRLTKHNLLNLTQKAKGTIETVTANEYLKGLNQYMYSDIALSDDLIAVNMLLPRVRVSEEQGVWKITENLGTLLTLLTKFETTTLTTQELERFQYIMNKIGVVNQEDLKNHNKDKSILRTRICLWYREKLINLLKTEYKGKGTFASFEGYITQVLKIAVALRYYCVQDIMRGEVNKGNALLNDVLNVIDLLVTTDNRVTVIGKQLASYIEAQCYTYTESVFIETLGEDLTDYVMQSYPLKNLYIIAKCIRYTVLNKPFKSKGQDTVGLEKVSDGLYRLKSPIPLETIPDILLKSIDSLHYIDNGRLKGIDIKEAFSELLSLYLVNRV